MRIVFLEKGMNTNDYINFREGIVVRPFNVEKYDSYFYRQQSGAVEACWAHNPEVRGSKPRSARENLLFVIYLEKNDNDCNVNNKKSLE